MKRCVVIVGAGHAGVQAAASLREEGFDGLVTLLGDEPDMPYHKPPLSKAFIADPAAAPQILRAEAFYEGAGIDLRLGARAEAIDRAARRLTLADGSSLAFDHLILATGSRPRPLRLAEAPARRVHALRSLADARAIRDSARAVEDVAIIGGGFIGLEVAATLAAIGLRVTVVEALGRLLGRAVAPAVAEHVRARLVERGVRVLTGRGVAALEGAGGTPSAVVLADGERIAAGMVIVGIGAVPDTALAEAAGLAAGGGVPVDASLRTADPAVFALGDLALFRHWQTGTELRLESVQNAHDQARHAARAILGYEEAFREVPWFWSDIGDMKLQMVGLVGGSDRTVVAGDPRENRFSVFHYRDGRLLGIESVNRPADHMLGRRMLAAGFSPEPEAAAAGAAKSAFAAWQAAAGSAPA